MIVPTIASTDAPCSALSVIYSDEGVFEKYLFLPANPNMVLVDTTIVAAAPVRLLVAGMGDALATYFEARACEASGATNCVGGKTTLAAMGLARLCYDTLLEDGVKAKLAVENVPETHSMYHGEKVAFGTLVQLVLENASEEELEEVLSFCEAVGLPTTLRQLGIEQPKAEQLMEVAKLACADSDTLHNMPFEVTPESGYAAILTADALGRRYAEL